MPTSIADQRPTNRADLGAWYASVLQQQEQAGLSIAEASEAVGVTPTTLYAWRRKLTGVRPRPVAAPAKLVRVRILDEAESGSSDVHRPPLVLRLTRGRAIEVPLGFDGKDLARLIAVTERC